MKTTFANFVSAAMRSRLAELDPWLAKELENAMHSIDLLAHNAELAGKPTRDDVESSPEETARWDGTSSDAGEHGSDKLATNTTSMMTSPDSDELKRNTKSTTYLLPATTLSKSLGYSIVSRPEPVSAAPSRTFLADECHVEVPTALAKYAGPPRFNDVYSQHDHSDLSRTLEAQKLLTLSLASPKTYSFNETNFARCLHRACLEDAFYLLMNPSSAPDAVWRKFNFALASSRYEDIWARLKIRLSRTSVEPLESSYHRVDDRQTLQGAECMTSAQCAKPSRFIGPQRPGIAVENPGESKERWFSPDDVQSFVESKGFRFNPTASFAEGEIISLVSSSFSDDIAVQATCLQSPPKTPDQFAANVPSAHGYSGADSFTPNIVDQTTSMIMHGSFDFVPLTNPHTLGVFGKPTLCRRRVLLDVAKFLNGKLQLPTSVSCVGDATSIFSMQLTNMWQNLCKLQYVEDRHQVFARKTWNELSVQQS